MLCMFEQAPGVGDGQGSLAWCSPWGHKESDTTETEMTETDIYHNKMQYFLIKKVDNLGNQALSQDLRNWGVQTWRI